MPGSQVMFVGPDAAAAIECIRAGTATRERVDGMIESRAPFQTGMDRWCADRHHWNCSGPRISEGLGQCGWVEVVDISPATGELLPDLSGWLFVSQAPLQCAVLAGSPS